MKTGFLVDNACTTIRSLVSIEGHISVLTTVKFALHQ